jgi:hypothetical protein
VKIHRLIGFTIGVAAGVIVTRRLHERPPTDFWARPVGRLPWRRADVPVGGVTALAVSAMVPAAIGRHLRSAGWGAVVGCLVVGVLDPYRG